MLRQLMFSKSEIILAAKPDDKAALVHWMVGQMDTFALCEAVALFGLVAAVYWFRLLRSSPFTLPVSSLCSISRRAVLPMR